MRNCCIDIPQLRNYSKSTINAGPRESGQAFIILKLPHETGGVNTENIKRLRLARGIGQAELARRIGVTKAAVLFMEQPGKYPEAARLPKIAQELGCTIDELYGEDAPRTS